MFTIIDIFPMAMVLAVMSLPLLHTLWKSRAISSGAAAIWLMLAAILILPGLLVIISAQANATELPDGHNSSTGYHQCLACHNGKPVPKLVLQSPLGAKSQALFLRFKECWKEGDQGCMNQVTDKTGKVLKGAKRFFRETWEKSRE